MTPVPDSSSEEAVAYEAGLRRAIESFVEADDTSTMVHLTRIVNSVIGGDDVQQQPILSAMRHNVLTTLAKASFSPSSLNGNEEEDEYEEGEGEGEEGGYKKDIVGKEEDDDEDDKDKDEEKKEEYDDDDDDDDDMGIYDENDKIEDANEKPWPEVKREVLQSLDAFCAVHVLGARCKASAFFDKLTRESKWKKIAVFAGSSVAEACFLAVNSKKRLTVIDVGAACPGRALVARLARQTQTSVSYAPLAAAHRALEDVHVVVMGAREVMMNGHVVVRPGGAFLAQAAQDVGVPLVIATQSVKYSSNALVDWAVGAGDVLRPKEIQSIVTELDTSLPTSAPDIAKKVVTA